jgi:serine protease Do
MNQLAFPLAAGVLAVAALTAAVAQDRNTKVLNDRDKVEASGFWIYNNLDKGIATAKQSGKPMLVVFRCVPCAHCAQLDESLVERDKTVQKLLEQFVCVRVVHANGMDLTQFQFDYDQSWAAFLMNADKTIYGRYGTRSHQTESADDMSLAGFGQALQRALELHKGYPKNKALFASKRGAPVDTRAPEEYPTLRAKYTSKLEYGPNVAKSCIHCHQVREAQRQVYRSAGKAFPETQLYPYPHPKILGLVTDPATRSTLKAVAPGSTAAADGFKPGDEIRSLEGQPILSLADLQWVLHHAGTASSLKAEVVRAGKSLPMTLSLPKAGVSPTTCPGELRAGT